MSLRAQIAKFATGSYTVTRVAAGAYGSDGKYTPGTTTTFQSVISVQPSSGRGLKVLPEGVHAEDVRVLFTADPLQVTPTPDVISIQGEDYAVIKSNGPYTLNGFTHYEVYAARQVVP